MGRESVIQVGKLEASDGDSGAKAVNLCFTEEVTERKGIRVT